MSQILNKTSQQIQALLQNTINEQFNYEKNGDYVEAENHRLKSEQLKKDLEVRKIYELEQKHKHQFQQLHHTQQNEIDQFSKFWQQKIAQYLREGEKLQQDMISKHQAELEQQRNKLQKQLSTKFKQSSQLLNLKKMEEHMVKQKNYVEAHKVQTRISQLQKIENQTWMINRSTKIEALQNQLRAKQSIQLNNLKKKIQTGLDQNQKARHVQQTKLQKKFANSERQLKSQHEKEIIHFKGQFKSKGGQSSPISSKSKIH